MSDEFDLELPEDILGMLDEARELEPLDDVVTERVWSRLESTLELGGLAGADLEGDAGGGAPTGAEVPADGGGAVIDFATAAANQAASSASAFSVSKVVAAVWTAATFTIGVAAGAGTHAIITDDGEPQGGAHERPIVAALDMSVPSPDMMAADMAQPDLSELPAVDMAPAVEIADQGTPKMLNFVDGDPGPARDFVYDVNPGGAEQADSLVEGSKQVLPPARLLAEERKLLSTAQEALARRDFDDAERSLRQHKSEFGRAAKLAEERDALYIRVLVARGSSASARARFELFQKNYPSSIFIDALAPAFQAAP